MNDWNERWEKFGGDLDSFGCVCPTIMSASREETRIRHFPNSEVSIQPALFFVVCRDIVLFNRLLIYFANRKHNTEK
jgi:hypothetical protein